MICTFYSYKGGVGRSMALGNASDSLAREGLKVLIIDFDLEAPGLEQFFQVNKDGIRRNLGLLDLLLTYKRSMSPTGGEATFKQLRDFICPVYERLPSGGRLDIMAAGQRQEPEQLARYALNLRTFDWQDFYYNWDGELFFEWLRRSLVPSQYDLVLVDSRTGVTEMGGVCGYQLADIVVMFCAANHQNIEGTANMVRDFRSPKVESMRQGRPLEILIVPARVEQRSNVLIEDFYRRFNSTFAEAVPGPLLHAGLSFRDLTIPYEPEYAFEERVLSDPARATARKRIAAAFQSLARAIVLLAEPGSSLARLGLEQSPERAFENPYAGTTAAIPVREPAQTEAQYDVVKRFSDYDVFVDYTSGDEEAAQVIIGSLKDRGLQLFVNREAVAVGSDWPAIVDEALFHSRTLVCCVGSEGLSGRRLKILERAVSSERGHPLTVFPVFLSGGDYSMIRGTPLERLRCLDLREGVTSPDFEILCRALIAAAPEKAPRVERETRAPYVVDPANPRLAAYFGKALANHARNKATDASEAKMERGEADFQTRRALKLAPDNDEVKKLRAEVVKLLQLSSE